MKTDGITYKVKASGEKDIYSHLMECSNNFIPALNERVNIEEYSKKIFEKATTFEAWANTKLVGLIAIYFDNENHTSFITNVSIVKEYMHLGIATYLLNMCINSAKEYKIKAVKLEVHKDNQPAITFYTTFNFEKIGTEGDNLTMKLKI